MKENKPYNQRKNIARAIMALVFGMAVSLPAANLADWDELLARGETKKLMDSLWESLSERKDGVCTFYKENAAKLLPKIEVRNLDLYKGGVRIEGLNGSKCQLEGNTILLELPENGRDGQSWKCGSFPVVFRFINEDGKEFYRAQRRIYPFIADVEHKDLMDTLTIELPIPERKEKPEAVVVENKAGSENGSKIENAVKKTASAIGSAVNSKEVKQVAIPASKSVAEEKSVVKPPKAEEVQPKIVEKAKKIFTISEWPIYPNREEIASVKITIGKNRLTLSERNNFATEWKAFDEMPSDLLVEIELKETRDKIPMDYVMEESEKEIAFSLYYRTKAPEEISEFVKKLNDRIRQLKSQRTPPLLRTDCERNIPGCSNTIDAWLRHLQTDDKCAICAPLREKMFAEKKSVREWDEDLFWKVVMNGFYNDGKVEPNQYDHMKKGK